MPVAEVVDPAEIKNPLNQTTEATLALSERRLFRRKFGVGIVALASVTARSGLCRLVVTVRYAQAGS